jgi:hypothetical protein
MLVAAMSQCIRLTFDTTSTGPCSSRDDETAIVSLNESRKAVRNSFVEAQNVSDSWSVVLWLEAQLTLEPVMRVRGE